METVHYPDDKGRLYFIMLIMIIPLVLSACTSPTAHSDPAPTNQTLSLESAGINKGQVPPDFTITTIDGKQLNGRKFKDNNRPVLLYFWTSWCPYCTQDLNTVKKIFPNYAKDVTFLAINMDLREGEDIIRNYKQKIEIEGADFAQGKESILSNYGIIYTTTKYAIGRNGTILYKGSGVLTEKQWEILLQGLKES